MHLLFARHLLDGFVVDLVHRRVGHRGLAGVLQQRFHQHLVAFERDAVLDVVTIGELLAGRPPGRGRPVAEIGDQVVPLLYPVPSAACWSQSLFPFGDRKVTLADIDAIGASHHGIGRRVLGAVLGPARW